ncbi:MAG: hypothetical protein ACREU7_00910, partial [Burkholderiales bacterium]
ELVRPAGGATLGAGRQRLFGLAWAGEEAVARVEVSTDGGDNWSSAELLGPFAPYSWTLWEYLWNVKEPGEYRLLSRATAASGRVQPRAHDPLLGGYMIHFSRPVAVQVQSQPVAAVRAADGQTLLYDMNAFAEANARLPLDVDLDYSYGAGI